MKKSRKIVTFGVMIVLAISSLGQMGSGYAAASKDDYAKSIRTSKQNNPIVTNGFTADPYAYDYNGRVYVYMSNDHQEYEANKGKSQNTYANIKSIRIISSDDMVNWTDHGTVEIAGPNGVCKWAGVSWAPAMVSKKVNGKDKFFLYFTNGGYQIGVATSDSPIGPFKDEVGKALLDPDNADTASVLDPAVFIDDDGTGYLTYGAGQYIDDKVYPGSARIIKLGADLISLAGKPIKIDAPYMNEDSGVNKIGDKYYFSYCTNWDPRNDNFKSLGIASIAYMMADSPTGPYKYIGPILSNCGEVFQDTANNHHSIINFKGKYYIFYHTLVLERESKPQLLGYRSTHVNEITVNPDATLNQVDQDLEGVKQIKYFDPYKITSGTTFCDGAGINNIHGFNVYMEAVASEDYKYSWTYIKGADFGSASPKSLSAKFLLSKESKDITFKVCADSVDGPEIANTTIKASSDDFYTISIPVNSITGVHDIYFEFSGEVNKFVSWQFKDTNPTSSTVNFVPATIEDVTVTQVKNVKAKNTSKGEVGISWTQIKGAQYKVAYSISKAELEKIGKEQVDGSLHVKFVDANSNKAILNKLYGKKKYYLKVCAIKKDGNNTIYGDWSSIIKVVTK